MSEIRVTMPTVVSRPVLDRAQRIKAEDPFGPGELERVAGGFGVYVHIPFCAKRCDYCAFATWTDRGHQQQAYVDAVCREIAATTAMTSWREPTTVFFGGGTPSLLRPEQLQKILSEIGAPVDAEVTVECNPESVDGDLVEGLVAGGVNRVSLGVQSMHDHVLAGLGRHVVDGALSGAVRLIAAAGIDNYNVDLIYGGAGESDDDWRDTLNQVLNFDPRPSHISAYALTVEAGTPLARVPARHPDDDVQAERYHLCSQVLNDAGYRWYEISNWARPGAECRHNLSCWTGGDYLGFGCASHSHLAGERFHNVVSIDRYLDAIATGQSPRARTDTRSPEEREVEVLELLLRTRAGVPENSFEDVDELAGLVDIENGRAVLTERGRMLANEVAIRIRPVDGTGAAGLGRLLPTAGVGR